METQLTVKEEEKRKKTMILMMVKKRKEEGAQGEDHRDKRTVIVANYVGEVNAVGEGIDKWRRWGRRRDGCHSPEYDEYIEDQDCECISFFGVPREEEGVMNKIFLMLPAPSSSGLLQFRSKQVGAQPVIFVLIIHTSRACLLIAFRAKYLIWIVNEWFAEVLKFKDRTKQASLLLKMRTLNSAML